MELKEINCCSYRLNYLTIVNVVYASVDNIPKLYNFNVVYTDGLKYPQSHNPTTHSVNFFGKV